MDDLVESYRVGVKRACPVVGLHRSAYYYKSTSKRDDTAIKIRMKEIVETRIRYGSPRVYTLLRREGFYVNHKRVERIYREQGYSLRNKRPKRRVSPEHRSPSNECSRLNEVWAMDFVSDALFNGRRIRALTVVDIFSREALAIRVGIKLTGADVIETLDDIAKERRLPERIKTDNGTEFTSLVYDKWAYDKGITTDYSRRGKPTDNGTIERFNGSLRDECLNVNWFLSLDDAYEKIESWRRDYNHFRPHSSLDDMTPADFAARLGSDNSALLLCPSSG